MAEDTIEKRRFLAAQFVAAIDRLCEAIELGGTMASEISSAGITFLDSDFEGSNAGGLRHLSATIIQNGLDQMNYLEAGSLVKYMIDNGIGVVFNKIRP